MPKHQEGLPIFPSEEAILIIAEKETGHKWRRKDGRILAAAIRERCIGPTCIYCGLQVCLLCEWPATVEPCEGKPKSVGKKKSPPERGQDTIPVAWTPTIPACPSQPAAHF